MTTHIVELPLKTTKYDDYMINKRFFAMWSLHNILVKHAKKMLEQLNQNKRYKELRSQYGTLMKKEKLSDEETALKKILSAEMNAILQSLKLSEYDFQAYLKVAGKRVNHMLSSTQVQKEATFVWRGVEKVLFSNGKSIHFKKFIDMNIISGKIATNGVEFDKGTRSIDWLGLHINCKFPKELHNDNKPTEYDYVTESLNHTVKFCEIKRRMFNNGWHYYLLIYLDGQAPAKLSVGTDTMGIDPGVSTIAGVGDNHLVLRELVPKSKDYNKKISKLQNRMNISIRNSNANNFNSDGTIKKGKHKWTFSKTYEKNRRKLKTLYRQKSEYIKHSHNALCNELIKHHNTFIVEAMNFSSLQKRAKNTKRQENVSTIRQKDGSVKLVHKCQKKKRFGKSINDRSPELFLSILEQKCKAYGATYKEVDTMKLRASQYNHDTDSYEKVPLGCREKVIGGQKVQRDLYSAFIIRYVNKNLSTVNKKKCKDNFDKFLKLQNVLIESMKTNHISMKQCFGF